MEEPTSGNVPEVNAQALTPTSDSLLTQHSRGSKLGTMVGAVITLAFFLPWVRACNTDLSGYDIAANSSGRVEDAWVYWLTLLAGLVSVSLFFVLRTNTARMRRRAAWTRLVAAIVGFFPLLNIYVNVQQQGTRLELLYGAWLVTLGYFGLFVSFFIDLAKPESEKD